VLYAPRSACIVSVFTRDLASDLDGAMAIGHVGRAVYDAYARQQNQASALTSVVGVIEASSALSTTQH